MPCLSGKFLFMRVCCPLVGIITILQRIFLEKIRGVGAGPLVKLPLSCGNSPGQPLASEAGELLWGLEAIAHLSVGYEWPGLGLPSSPLVVLEVWPLTSSISISITWVFVGTVDLRPHLYLWGVPNSLSLNKSSSLTRTEVWEPLFWGLQDFRTAKKKKKKRPEEEV